MMFVIVGMYALFAMSFTIAKILLSYVTPIFLIAIRMSIAGVLLLLGWYIFSKKKQQIKIRHNFIYWSLFATIHIVVPYITEFIALETIAPSCSALIFNLTPFFSAFFSYWFFNEKMTMKKYIGFLIGFAGISIFMQSQVTICSAHWVSYMLCLIAVIAGAFGWIFVRKLVLEGYDVLYINGLAMLLAGIQSFGLAIVFEPNAHWPYTQSDSFVGWLVLIIFLTNIMYYNIYAALLKKYSATLLSFFGCVIPLFVALFDWMLLGLSISIYFVISLAIASFGVYIFYQEELRQGYIK